MSEVEKLYSLAGVKKQLYCDICKAREHALGLCAETKCDVFYPPFTAEKQLLLLEWLLDKTDLYLHRHKTDFTYSIASGNFAVNKYKDFKESIAEFINAIWQDLTEAEQNEIKNILKG